MKRIKVVVAMLILGLMVTKECAVAQAVETGVTVISHGLEIRELSQAELTALSGEVSLEITGEEQISSMTTSYTAYEYAETFDFTLEGTWVAQADAKCIVYHYTDGKVHLYSRTITITRLATYDATRTYGRIVNTDGSLSYTTGDRVGIIGDDDSWDFALDFRVTPTEAEFSCYGV